MPGRSGPARAVLRAASAEARGPLRAAPALRAAGRDPAGRPAEPGHGPWIRRVRLGLPRREDRRGRQVPPGPPQAARRRTFGSGTAAALRAARALRAAAARGKDRLRAVPAQAQAPQEPLAGIQRAKLDPTRIAALRAIQALLPAALPLRGALRLPARSPLDQAARTGLRIHVALRQALPQRVPGRRRRPERDSSAVPRRSTR